MQVFSNYWIAIAAAAGLLLLLALGGWLLWRRRRKRPLTSVLDAVSVESVRDVLIPDGMGGRIQIDYLLLTARGLVVLDIKDIRGTVFASDRMDEWTAINDRRRFGFQNPQSALYDRLAAIRLVIRDVPLSGHILFPEQADFSKGKPKDIILPDELLARYQKPEEAELERLMEAFYPHWERLCEVFESFESRPR